MTPGIDKSTMRSLAHGCFADARYFYKHLRRARQDAPHLADRFAELARESHEQARQWLRQYQG